jgi:hypothetical protein
MHSNRISQFLASDDVPAAAQATAVPAGFVVVPVTILAVRQDQPVAPQPDIYRIAREQALADARWSAIEKRLFSVWN